MLMQEGFVLDQNNHLYELLVPKDNELRKTMGHVDFSFVYDALENTYCHDNSRRAISPVQLFKYLISQTLYQLSDVDVMRRSLYDLSFKYFLEFDLEETNLIDPSLLTKFRRTRLATIDLLDQTIAETMRIAIDNKLIKSTAIIVDSTHSLSRYNQKSPKEAIIDLLKNLRKQSYRTDEKM